MIACRTAALSLLLLYILGERRERATRQANNAIFVHRINLSRIYKSYASFAGFLACVQTSPVFVPRATKKEVGTRKFHTNNARFGVNETALLILFSDNCCWFFFLTRKNILPSRKISDVRMPRIPSVSTTNSNPGSRSTSGLVLREHSREQELG